MVGNYILHGTLLGGVALLSPFLVFLCPVPETNTRVLLQVAGPRVFDGLENNPWFSLADRLVSKITNQAIVCASALR